MRYTKLLLVVPLLAFGPLNARADDPETAKLASECSAPDLPQSGLDSCLERVRVREETEPSAQLQALEATLEQRESGRPTHAETATTSPRAIEVAPEPMAPDGPVAQDQSAPEPNEVPGSPVAQDQSAAPVVGLDSPAERSGAELEDEPPVADAPDAPAETDRTTGDDTNEPPHS